MSTLLRTGVSAAYWCGSDGTFSPAETAADTGTLGHRIAWLDRLLDGGIWLPDKGAGEPRALTLLVAGPPGSGKSTLALELCHRLGATTSRTGTVDSDAQLTSLYVSSEAPEHWIVEKARSFGWKGRREAMDDEPSPLGRTVIVDVTGFDKLIDSKKSFFDALTRAVKIGGTDLEPLARHVEEKWKAGRARGIVQSARPDMVVIDSLNTFAEAERGPLFDHFMKLVRAGPRIIVIVLESDRATGSEPWEYLSDVVIRLDRTYPEQYMVRTLEIVKARYQSHVWGPQKLKIYGHSPIPPDVQARRRAHPYREEGGIFIYPSIHYYLSIYKKQRQAPSSAGNFVPTSIPAFDDILHGGFPRGRCTGFVGVRGGHKSHLAYRALLDRVRQPRASGMAEERGVIISLRDDEMVVRRTLSQILRQELNEERVSLKDLEADDRLAIVYYPPGYVTPEEFFHKMFMSVRRLKHDTDANISVVFNSLDQLAARFPLCAEEQIFVPGIVEVLSGEGATSWFIAVEEEGQPPEQYGLMSMADALLEFRRERIERADYLGHVKSYRMTHPLTDVEAKELDRRTQEVSGQLPASIRSVAVRVVRYAGGQAAGAGGMLELVEPDMPQAALFGKQGLQFVPFSPGYVESAPYSRPASASS